MKLHPEELRLARAYDRSRAFEPLSAGQVHLIMERGRTLFKWYKAHPRTHNLINLIVLSSIFAVDAWALLGLPRLFLAESPNAVGSILLAALVTATVHSWLLYSLAVYSLHEGAAHNAIFSGTGRCARIAQFIARNACRMGGSDPEYYAECHMGHHSKFGTEGDPEFLNFVMPRRLWLALLPFASFINFTDFVAHRPLTYTRSRILSGVVGASYNGGYAWLMSRSYGPIVPLLTILLVVHIAFYFDRLRQFTEHNLMPLENRVGARSFGVGFWGLLIGGGPWGQPCHLVHHMVASVPWYQQIVLHRYMKSLLTPQQRRQFLVTPVVGFPRLLWRVVHDANRFAKDGQVHTGA